MKDMKKDMGLSKFMHESGEMKVVPAQVETQTKSIEMNYGQKMCGNKFMHASKPWKPKGRK